MKTILLALGLSFASHTMAQAVYVNPIILNFGYQAQVQINNSTSNNLNCSGTVNMHTQLGRVETGFYSAYIPKNSMSVRSLYLTNFNDRITFTNHFINCYKTSK